MPVIIPPPRRNALQRLLLPLLAAGGIAAVVAFLIYRFGDTPLEKAEKLFQKRDLAGLAGYTRSKLEKGENHPLFYSYFAVAEFSNNPGANLASVLGNISAVDDRPAFRRDALTRILQVQSNLPRAGMILTEILKLEQPPGAEMKLLIQNLVQSEAPLAGDPANFDLLRSLFPADIVRVNAKELQWRGAPNTDAQVLRRLAQGEELLIRLKGGPTIVSGKKGAWVLALDGEMNSGWVFDAYLKKVPNE